MSVNQLELALCTGAEKLNLDLKPDQIQKLLAYLDLLIKWNKTYNLTAITQPQKMLTHHVLDSLSVAPYLNSQNKIIDIGTGGGIPGLILAIACPDKFFSLLDSNGKKTRFLTQTIYELGLKNCEVLNMRAEEAGENIKYKNQFDIVISRAFSSLIDMFSTCQNLLNLNKNPGSFFLAMKGKYLETNLEIEDLKLKNKLKNIEKILIQVPGIQEERCLVKFN